MNEPFRVKAHPHWPKHTPMQLWFTGTEAIMRKLKHWLSRQSNMNRNTETAWRKTNT